MATRKKTSALNDRQKEFVRHYVVDFNGTQAAIRAGYSAKTAGAASSRLLQNVKIHEFMAQLVKDKADKTELSIERVLAELSAMAFLDPIDLFTSAGVLKPLEDIPESARRAITGIEIAKDGSGQESIDILKLKLADKKGSLELLARYLQMFVDKSEVKTESSVTFNMVYHESTD